MPYDELRTCNLTNLYQTLYMYETPWFPRDIPFSKIFSRHDVRLKYPPDNAPYSVSNLTSYKVIADN